MKTKQILKEAIIWLIIAIPLVYFGLIYKSLPEQIPIHFDIHGNPDNYAAKGSYWWIIILTTLGVYLLMLIIPLIDPKKRLQQMGNKYYVFKLLIVGLMSIISIMSVYAAANPQKDPSLLIMVIMGLMFMLLGNYMPSFKPNYFIGIRTPWTLESEDNWRKTHRIGGWTWTLTGLVVIILALLKASLILTIGLILLAAFIPVVYSFILYLKNKK